ncbi:tRNA dihydrouridine synthase DusB [Tautonia marina]|uniref:tRNA dihydrouridine synthase DusB n=1 Tax=Tautonia marina TaxID=2653855 RepID=UPI001F3C4101|nr:tRNA dihydrouridine synthase DusB [Tautonia marina]
MSAIAPSARPDHSRPLPAPPARAKEALTIGSVTVPTRFFLSPLAGYTALAYRLTVRELGGLGLATTDLVNARSLIEKRAKAFDLAATCGEDQPASIQIYGATAWEMIEATKIVSDLGPSIIDINMGCPVRKVVKCGGGSALMCDSEGAKRLVGAVVEHSPVPVTVKMRLGWDQQNPTAPELARLFESIGVAAVIVHGRTRAQGFSGSVDREGIARVVEAVDRMPIIGNGDIRTLVDAEAMFRETGCAAISIGRGSLSNPFLFRQLLHWAEHGTAGPEPGFEDRLDVMVRHFHRLVETRGEHLACLQFRKVLKWYSYAIRPPKELYLQLVNLPSVAVFDTVVSQIRAAGPSTPLPSQFEPRVPTPKGPIDKW